MCMDGEKANSMFDPINTGWGNRGQSKDAKSNLTGAL